MTPNETDLRTSLNGEADRVEVVGDFATAAMALARRRGRRRQAMLVGAGVAAALAVAVPVAISQSRGTPPVRPAPASATTPAATRSATSGPVQTSDPVPTSEPATPTTAPAVAASSIYALDDTIRAGDKVFHLEKGTQVENLSVLSNGGFVLQSHLTVGASQSEVELLSAQGRLVGRLGVSGFYAVSPDGSRVIVQDGATNTVTVLDPEGVVLAKRSDGRYPVAVVGDHAYLQGDASTSSLDWNYVTNETRKLPAHVAAVSSDRARAALQWVRPSDTNEDFCWSVVDLTSSTPTTLVERCGVAQNPDLFQPTAFSADGAYLVGSNYVDGGFWFSAAVVRVSDGAMVLGGSGDHLVAGWTWRLDGDALVISRNPTAPKSEQNTLQRCTLGLKCTELAPPLPVGGNAALVEPRYVVPRSIPR